MPPLTIVIKMIDIDSSVCLQASRTIRRFFRRVGLPSSEIIFQIESMLGSSLYPSICQASSNTSVIFVKNVTLPSTPKTSASGSLLNYQRRRGRVFAHRLCQVSKRSSAPLSVTTHLRVSDVNINFTLPGFHQIWFISGYSSCSWDNVCIGKTSKNK